MSFRWFIYNFASAFSVWRCLPLPFLMAVITVQQGLGVRAQAQTLKMEQNVWDVLYAVFSGPPRGSASILDFCVWVLPYYCFFLLVGQMASRDLEENAGLVFPRLKSGGHWWMGKVTAMTALSAIYLLFAMLLSALTGFLFAPWDDSWSLLMNGTGKTFVSSMSPVQLFAQMFVLIWSTMLWMALLLVFLTVTGMRSIYALWTVLIMLGISWVSGVFGTEWIPLFPGNQGIWSRHMEADPAISGFDVPWSVTYNLLFLAVAVLGGWWYSLHADLVKGREQDH